MCMLCGRPELAHDGGGFPAAVQAGDAGPGASGGGGAAALSAGAQAQISYLNGITSSGTIAGTSFWTWNYNNSATYSSISDAAKWGSTTPGTSGGTVTYWFDVASAWTATEKAALVSGLALWSALGNINFSLASSASAANFIFYEGTGGSAYESSNSWSTSVGSGSTGGFYSTGSVISIDADVPGFGPIGPSFGTYGGYPYQTLLHEIGHLIGLGHGGPYNGNVNVATQQFSAYDTRLWTIMSYINPLTTSAKYYSSYPVTGTNWGISADGYYNVPTTPMILDIAAVQQLYGVATSGPLAGGGKVFGFNSNLATSIKAYFDFTVNTNPVVTLWASGVNNTLDLSGWSNPATINLNPGTFSSAHGLTNNIGIADGAVIDKAIGGSGNDNITGSSINNTLTGKGGGDTINGGGGSDTAVYSGSKSQYQITLNGDGSIRLVDLRSGSPDGTDTVSNVEFFQFADGTFSAASLFNAAPVATAPDYAASKGEVINASSLFSASDADGDTLTYFFLDNTSGPTSGYFTVNGVVKPANVTFAVSAAQLAQTTFHAGTTVSDDLFVNVYDGVAWSNPKEFHVNVPPNQAPVVTVSDYSASSGQVISASSLFTATDANNDTLLYFFLDNTSGPTSGYFTVNGVVKPANVTFAVSAAQLAQTTFHAGTTGSDDLFVNVYDGVAWSNPKEFHVNVPPPPPNQAPVVTVSDYSASSGQVISASSLFTATDANNDTLLYFFLDDTSGPTSGYFTVNGVVKPANVTFAVSAAQLAQTTFHAGTTVSDDLFVNVYDGVAWSNPKEFHVNVPPNQAPVVTVSDYSASSGQVISASSLFTATDANNDTLLYFFLDNTSGPTSGYFTVNGVVKPANVTFAVSAAQLAQTTFHAGTTGSDDLFVNVYDGVAWSNPKEFHVNVPPPPPNQAPVVTVSDYSASSGQVISASSLFTATDANNDTLLYFFLDDTSGPTSGYFTVNGVVKPANVTFAVSAAQLAQTTFHAGTTVSDDLFVNVYDGVAWSNPKEFHVIAPADMTAPAVAAMTSHQSIYDFHLI